MTTYSIIDNQTGEVMLEADSQHLQAADKLLQASKRLGLHTAAQSTSNRRDRDLLYGSHKQPPKERIARVRRAKPRRYMARQPRRQPSALLQLLIGVGMVVVGAVAIHQVLQGV